MTGDEAADPAKLKRLLEDNVAPQPIAGRKSVRLEAENFRELEGCKIEDKNDRAASHRLNVKSTGGAVGIRTAFAEPYVAAQGRYDIEVRYRDQPEKVSKLSLRINGMPRGAEWESTGQDEDWKSHTIKDIEVRAGDAISVQSSAPVHLDYVQLNAR